MFEAATGPALEGRWRRRYRRRARRLLAVVVVFLVVDAVAAWQLGMWLARTVGTP